MALLAALALAASPGWTVSAEARRIDPNFMGWNSDMYALNEPWQLKSRRAAAAEAGPGAIRYPGGTSSTYWDFANDSMFRNVDEIDDAPGDPAAWIQTQYTIDWVARSAFWLQKNSLQDLSRLVHHLDDEPDVIWTANMATPGPDYFDSAWGRGMSRETGSTDWWSMMGARRQAWLTMLDRAKQLGLPVRRVELGNEYYFGAGTSSPGQGAPVEPYVAGSFAADRNFEFEDVGAFPDRALPHYGLAANDWARAVRASHPRAHAAAIGSFVHSPGLGERSEKWNESALSALDPGLVSALTLHLYGGPQKGSLTGTAEEHALAREDWQRFWREGMGRSRLPAGYDLWITEFNIDDEFGNADNLPDSRGAWGNGLGNLFCVSTWLTEEPRIQLALLHELPRAIQDDGPGITAAARAWSLWIKASQGHTRARALASPEPGRDVAGWRFEGGGPPRLALVNWSAEPVEVPSVTTLLGSPTASAILATAPLSARQDPGVLGIGLLPGQALRLPAHSAAVVEAD